MMIKTSKQCEIHQIPFDLIGNDKFCDMNCLICCDCLRTLDHQHKYEGINHKTITIQQITQHFTKIRNYSLEQISKCKDHLNSYFDKFLQKLSSLIQKQRKRLNDFIQNIMFTQITKNQTELHILEQLYERRYNQLLCNEVGSIAKKLFSFIPTKVSPGYQMFRGNVAKLEKKLDSQVEKLINNNYYNQIVMREIKKQTDHPIFMEQIRIKTQQTSRSKTPRRTLRKKQTSPVRAEKSLLDIKDFHVKIRKPLEFKGSEIIKTKQDIGFIEKLFSIRVYGAKMLYKASQNNFSVVKFHQLCDNFPNTIIFVKTQFNKVIGGFTTIPWKSTNNTVHTDIKKQSFLFSVSLKQKMKLIDEKAAIFNSLNFGPTFGGGADLSICHNSNVEKTSYSQFPFSYANPRYLDNNQHSTFLFTGQQNGNHFLIKQWEVWKLDFNE